VCWLSCNHYTGVGSPGALESLDILTIWYCVSINLFFWIGNFCMQCCSKTENTSLYWCSCLRMFYAGLLWVWKLALLRNRSSIFILFQHTFSSLVKQKPPKTSPTKSRGTMAVSMREVDSVFQGVGQKEYPSVSILLLVTLSTLIPLCCFIARISCAIISLTSHYIISIIIFSRIFLDHL
jgi:hypothetical protein